MEATEAQQPLVVSIGRLVGADRVRASAGLERTAAEIVVEPAGEDELAEIVRKCEADRIALAPLGAARTLAQIRVTPVPLGVSLVRMARVVAYEPDDMTCVAEAGITLGALNRVMAARAQHLPADPRNPDATTIGALIGAAQAGPLRLSEGTVRDLLIGVRFIGREGRLVHGGGRVVKNVAGYDLMKVLTGSFGTLGIVTEAAFKVRPVPENCSMALAVFGPDADPFPAAQKLHDLLTLVHLEVLSPAATDVFGHPGSFVLLAGFAGIRSELDHQWSKALEVLGRAEILDNEAARDGYRRLRDFEFSPDVLVAQIAVPPAELPRCLRECGAHFRAHAGSGVAQIWTESDREAAAETLKRWRDATRSARGNLRLISAPATVRPALDFFDVPPAGALALMKRLKAAFDPVGIFNPGCFAGGL